MKVLMFGWEFPPHISGGLGTACFGLSQSLMQENVDLVFVVPRAHGSSDAVRLVDARDIFIPEAGKPRKIIDVPVRKTTTKSFTVEEPSTVKVSEGIISVVTVDANLDPYAVQSIEKKQPIEQWNYMLEPPVKREVTEQVIVDETRQVEIVEGYHYNFSGGYGEGLSTEVNQYSLVGAELAKQFSHDIIHAHDWMTFAAGIEAKKVSGKPLVVHVHATEYDRSGSLQGPVYEMEKRGMELADRVVAVSQWTKDILVSKYGVNADKVEVVHNGIVAANGSEPSTDVQTPLGSQVVTFLGRVTYQKGPAYFVEAARKVSERFPDAHFVVAGSGDLLPQTIERVAELRMSEKFHFTGFLSKEWIDKVWSMSSVYVMPSVSEPFGITPLEAIQAGVPVIVSKQSGVAEVIPHALKVNFWDVDALAESICSVLKYDSLSTMLKDGGENQIKELSWKKAALKLKNLYEELTPEFV